MTDISTVACPNCATPLVADGLSVGERVQCARCRTQFHLGIQGVISPVAAGTMPRTESGTLRPAASIPARASTLSRAANAARALGILSILPLVGVGAFVAGCLGLRDIRRYPAKKGTGRAVFAIIAGTVSTVIWLFVGLIIVSAALSIRSIKRTDRPEEVAAIALQIAPFTPPRDLKPVLAEDVPMLQRRYAVYGASVTEPPEPAKPSSTTPPAAPTSTLGSMLVVERFLPQWAGQPETMESWLRQRVRWYPRSNMTVDETRTVTYTVRGQPVQVTRRVGCEAGGERRREYVGFIVDGATPIGVLINTGDEPPDADADATTVRGRHSLTEDEVRAFFETIEQAMPPPR